MCIIYCKQNILLVLCCFASFNSLNYVDNIWGTIEHSMDFPVLKLFIHSLIFHRIINEKTTFVYLCISLQYGTLKMSFISYSHFVANVAKQTFLTVTVIYWCLKVQWIIQPLYPSCFAAHLLSFQSSFISINLFLLCSSNFMVGLF